LVAPVARAPKKTWRQRAAFRMELFQEKEAMARNVGRAPPAAGGAVQYVAAWRRSASNASR